MMIMMAALLAMSLSACSQANKQKENKEMKKVLVAYFSATGTTKAVAQQLAKVADADLHEITPEQRYTDADLDWQDKQSRSSVEMKDKKSRPAIKGKLENMDDYEVVFVGFPIWWYTCPTIINTFMEAIEKACEDLKATYPDINWKEGKLLNRVSKKDLEDWVQELQ